MNQEIGDAIPGQMSHPNATRNISNSGETSNSKNDTAFCSLLAGMVVAPFHRTM
jgi:hypothetical protein